MALAPEKVYPELLMRRLLTSTSTASIEIAQVPSAPPNVAPLAGVLPVPVPAQSTSLAPLYQTVFPAVVSQLPLPAVPEPFWLGSQIRFAAETRPIPRVKQNTPKREMAAILRKDTGSRANRAVGKRGVVSFIFVSFMFVGCD